MLFDITLFRNPLPADVQVFASGANRRAEIEGFSRLGIPVGVSVDRLNEAAIAALLRLQQPVMVDSGAFSEVVFERGTRRIRALIDDNEWRRRLEIYHLLTSGLQGKVTLVAPDQVGDQQETLSRVGRYRAELMSFAQSGATLLLPLQVGSLSHVDFYNAASRAAGFSLTPAMPMRKAVTSAAAVVDFIRAVQPERIHLLGMGIDHPRASGLIRLLRAYSPSIKISMDSNRIRAVVGRGRRLTRCEEELRSVKPTRVYGAVESAVLTAAQVSLDYTDLIARPSLWAESDDLHAIASESCLTAEQRARFLRVPESLLQSDCDGFDGLLWIEHPLMSLALDSAWERRVQRIFGTHVRAAAILQVFGDPRLRLQNTSTV